MRVPLTHLVLFDIIMANSWSFLYDEIMSTNEIYEDTLPEFTPQKEKPLYHGSGRFTYTFTDVKNFYQHLLFQNFPDLPDNNNNGRWKYHEDKILKDIHDYVSGTYRSHYTGKSSGFKDIQTIDLMAAKGLASAFCQSNIIKYGTRYGDKDGKIKKIY